jgi:alpha-aminoadipate/glutamate carrier protein LysW
MALCPECGAAIEAEEDEVEEGQILECPECDARLEVVNTHPLEMDVIPEEDEDEEEAEV